MTECTAIERIVRETIGLDAESIGRGAFERTVRAARSCANGCTACAAELRDSPEAREALIEQLVVPETWFFRDREPFVYLVEAMRGVKRGGAALRILSAPCSTGEEPYSIAMALLDAGFAPGSFAVDAIEISRRALAVARAASYGPSSFRGERRDEHFVPSPGGLQVEARVTSAVSFRQANMCDPRCLAGEQPYDAVFCRNLLIYLAPEARQIVLGHLRRLLAPDGIVFTGHAELPAFLGAGFVAIPRRGSFACRRGRLAGKLPEKRLARRSGKPARVTGNPARRTGMQAPGTARPAQDGGKLARDIERPAEGAGRPVPGVDDRPVLGIARPVQDSGRFARNSERPAKGTARHAPGVDDRPVPDTARTVQNNGSLARGMERPAQDAARPASGVDDQPVPDTAGPVQDNRRFARYSERPAQGTARHAPGVDDRPVLDIARPVPGEGGLARNGERPAPDATGQEPRPAADPGLLALARGLADRGDLEQASTLCDGVLRQDPGNVEAYYLKGLIEQSCGHMDRAEEWLRKTIYLEPGHYEALLHMSALANGRGDRKLGGLYRERARRADGKRENDRG
jgi:chemotaxis protein methyltransferase WspC